MLLIGASVALAQAVTSQFYDSNTTGLSGKETILTPAKVKSAKFGLTCRADPGDAAAIYAQPLYLPHLTISGAAHDTGFAVTMGNTAFAFDANNCRVLWRTHLGPTWPDPMFFTANLYHGQIGSLSTPVIDRRNGWMFIVSVDRDPKYTIRKLSITTGAVLSSRVISASVPGTGTSGDHTSSQSLLFTARWHVQREGLVIGNGNVYVAFSQAGIVNVPWHGWIMSYDEAGLTQQHVLCVTPTGRGGGLWGGAPSMDANGNLYLITGDGTYDGMSNLGNSFIKVGPNLSITDWFTPYNYAAISSADQDIASNRALLIPRTAYLVSVSKDFVLRLIDSLHMQRLQPAAGANLRQSFSINPAGKATVTSGSYGAVFMNNSLYVPTTNGPIYRCVWNPAAELFTIPCVAGTATFSYPGAAISGSCNNASNCILWAVTVSSSALFTARRATLRALNPSDLSEYWSDREVGDMSKFATPTVAGGKVMVSTQNGYVAVYGLRK